MRKKRAREKQQNSEKKWLSLNGTGERSENRVKKGQITIVTW